MTQAETQRKVELFMLEKMLSTENAKLTLTCFVIVSTCFYDADEIYEFHKNWMFVLVFDEKMMET